MIRQKITARSYFFIDLIGNYDTLKTIIGELIMQEKSNEMFLNKYNELKNSNHRFKIRYFNTLIMTGYLCIGSILFLSLTTNTYYKTLLYIITAMLIISPIIFFTLNIKVLKFGSMIYKGDLKKIFPDLSLPEIATNEYKLIDSLINHKGYHGNLIMEIQEQIDKSSNKK